MSQPSLTRLVFAGEAIVDLLMRVPALPERGGDMLAESAAVEVGGGFNIMAAAVRQGLPVVYAGGHGTGPWGDKVRAALAAEGIGLLRPPDPYADTGFDVALVEGRRRADVRHRPGRRVAARAGRVGPGPGPARRRGLRIRLRPGPARVGSGPRRLGGRPAARSPAVRRSRAAGRGHPGGLLDPVLARCDWWSCNQREAALLTGSRDPTEAARRLAGRTGRADVIVRAGPDGCVVAMRTPGPAMADGLSLSQIPAPAVTAVDTTGAGDAHSGVFLASLAAGLTVGDAARRANAAAALTVTRSGAATSPTRAELDQFVGF